MRTLSIGVVAALALAGGAAAQERGGPERPVVIVAEEAADADEAARRRALAERYVELSQGDGIAEMLRAYVDQLLAAESDVPTEQREWFRAHLPREMTTLMTTLMDSLVPLFAERLTVEELEALVAFYETPMGQSIARKQVEIGMDQAMAMEAAMVRFQADLMQKFCTAFDCGLVPTTPSRSGKPGE